MAKQKHKTKLKDRDYERLGKMLVSIGELGFANPHRVYWMAFIKGMLGGLGGVIGATLLLAVFLFILSVFGEIPLIGEVADNIRDSIQGSDGQ